MKYFEFGKENEELMVLLHGGGTSYLGVLPTAKKIAEKYVAECEDDKEYTEDDFIEVYHRTEAQELDYYHPRFRMYDGVRTTKRFDIL